MKLRIEMPEVMGCQVEECVYNMGSMCHARGITMGDEAGHLCDTMMKGQGHTHRSEPAGVGACRAIQCLHNEDFLCQADGVQVAMQEGRADCMTFKAR